jgi:peptidoglycan/xylan/chitin deacetylase (PgdA/CDA1 family)
MSAWVIGALLGIITLVWIGFRRAAKQIPVFLFIPDGNPGEYNNCIQLIELLKRKGFRFLTLKEFEQAVVHGDSLPAKTVLLTFDGRIRSFCDRMYPFLWENQIPAALFISAGELGATEGRSAADVLLEMFPLVQYGLRSYRGDPFKGMSGPEIESDLVYSLIELGDHKIPLQMAFSYPGGQYPKGDEELFDHWKFLFSKMRISLAFRYGNKMNKRSVSDPFAINRIVLCRETALWRVRLLLSTSVWL